MGVLKVLLVRITNLTDEDHMGKSDPYVKFEVEKDGWLSDKIVGCAESTHKKDDMNPEFNEQFVFNIPELKDHILKIQIMDDDVGKDEKLGKAEIKLGEQGIDNGAPKEIEVVVDDNWFSKDAKATLVLTWCP